MEKRLLHGMYEYLSNMEAAGVSRKQYLTDKVRWLEASDNSMTIDYQMLNCLTIQRVIEAISAEPNCFDVLHGIALSIIAKMTKAVERGYMCDLQDRVSAGHTVIGGYIFGLGEDELVEIIKDQDKLNQLVWKEHLPEITHTSNAYLRHTCFDEEKSNANVLSYMRSFFNDLLTMCIDNLLRYNHTIWLQGVLTEIVIPHMIHVCATNDGGEHVLVLRRKLALMKTTSIDHIVTDKFYADVHKVVFCAFTATPTHHPSRYTDVEKLNYLFIKYPIRTRMIDESMADYLNYIRAFIKKWYPNAEGCANSIRLEYL